MKLFRFLPLLCLTLSLTGCVDPKKESDMSSNESSTEETSTSPEELPIVNSVGGNKLVMEKYAFRMQLGETKKLVIEALPEGFTAEDVLFLSDNERSVVVSRDGTVTAMQSGAASIGVAIAGTSTRATVTVMVSN